MTQLPGFLQEIRPMSSSVNTFAPRVSQTQEKINKLAQASVPQQQQEIQQEVYEKDRFFADIVKVETRENIDTDSAAKAVMEAYKKRGIQVDGISYEDVVTPAQQSIPQEAEQEKNIVESFKDGMDNAVGGFITNTPEVIGNIFGFLADVITPKEYEGLGQFFRDNGVKDKENMQKMLGVDPDAFSTQIGEFTNEIATLGLSGGVGVVSKLEKAPLVAKGLSNLGVMGGKIAKSIGLGAEEMAKFGIVSDGEVTKEDIIIGGVGGVAIPILTKPIKWTGETIYKKAFRPSKAEAESIFHQAVNGGKKVMTKADSAFEKGVWGSQKGVGVSAVKESKKLWKNEVQPLLEKSKNTISKNDMFKVIEERVLKEVEPGRKADLAKALEKLKKEYASDPLEYSMTHAQKLKSGLDKFTPKKSFKGEDIAQAYKELKSDMANFLRQNLHNKLSSEFGVNTANKYMQYANLSALRELGVKGIQTGGQNLLLTPGGTGTLIANLWGSIMTPIQTAGGLTLYKVGDAFTVVGKTGLKAFNEYIADIIDND